MTDVTTVTTAATHAVDLSPIVTTAVEFVAAALLAVVTWLAGKAVTLVSSWTGLKDLESDEKVRKLIEEGLTNAIAFAKNKAMLASKDVASVDVKNEMVEHAIEYATAHIPDALAYFDVTPDKLREKITARLPQ